jgi:hypothetical protein
MILLASALLAFTGPAGTGPAVEQCVVVGRAGEKLTPSLRLYPNRHDRRFALRGQLFLDMRYNALAGKIAATVVKAPHAPWTFGEAVVEGERVFKVSGSGVGSLPIEALQGVTLNCEPLVEHGAAAKAGLIGT